MFPNIVYLPMVLLQEHKTDANQYLSCIIQDNVVNPKALPELFSEGIDDKNNIADKEQKGSQGEYRSKRRWLDDQVAYCNCVHKHDSSDINYTEYLERQFRGDDLEKPQDQKSSQSKSYCNAYLPVCGHLKNCDKIHNMSCQENEDTNKKCQLSSLL